MKKVTGLGGIFFKCSDPQKVKDWYSTHLGLDTDAYGTNFEWRQGAEPEKKGFTQWSPASRDSKHFDGAYMINYRVADLDALVAELKQQGVEVLGDVETFEYGKFAHILDPEGNKVELWEPDDAAYDTIVEGRTK